MVDDFDAVEAPPPASCPWCGAGDPWFNKDPSAHQDFCQTVQEYYAEEDRQKEEVRLEHLREAMKKGPAT